MRVNPWILSTALILILFGVYIIPKVIAAIRYEMEPINGIVLTKEYEPERNWTTLEYEQVGFGKYPIYTYVTKQHHSPERFYLIVFDRIQHRERRLRVSKYLYESTSKDMHVDDDHIREIKEYNP